MPVTIASNQLDCAPLRHVFTLSNHVQALVANARRPRRPKIGQGYSAAADEFGARRCGDKPFGAVTSAFEQQAAEPRAVWKMA
jgi:hypothetical protein